jgi:peptide-methionine (S)-S-oxide reductase
MILFETEEQHRAAASYITQLSNSRLFPRPIVTQLLPFSAFYPAEEYHQDYARHHPTEPYIAINDLPKVEHLKTEFPALYSSEGVRWTK